MDLEIIIIGILSVALFIVPIYLIQKKQKGKVAKARQAFVDRGAQRQLNITTCELWNPAYAIGIDEQQRKLLYLSDFEQQTREQLVDLDQVKQCRVLNEYRDSNGNRMIDHIALVLSMAGPKPGELQLEFYNNQISMMHSDELKVAEKWNATINAVIAARPKLVKV